MIGKPEYNYVIEVSEADCLSCGLCINTCPGLKGNKALEFSALKDELKDKEQEVFEYLDNQHHINVHAFLIQSYLIVP